MAPDFNMYQFMYDGFVSFKDAIDASENPQEVYNGLKNSFLYAFQYLAIFGLILSRNHFSNSWKQEIKE